MTPLNGQKPLTNITNVSALYHNLGQNSIPAHIIQYPDYAQLREKTLSTRHCHTIQNTIFNFNSIRC